MPSSMNWVDGAAGGTPVSAANLNKLAVVADIGVAGTPTGDAGRGAFVAHGDLLYNVKDYGAKGDGVTDDTAAINAAITALPAISGSFSAASPRLYFPAGRYITSGGHVIPSGKRVSVIGDGPFISILYRASAATGDLLTLNSQNSGVRDLTVDGGLTGAPSGGDGIVLNAGYNYIDNCTISNNAGNGVTVGKASAAILIRLTRLLLRLNKGYGIYVLGSSGSTDGQWSNVDVGESGLAGIRIASSAHMLTNVHSWGNGLEASALTDKAGFWLNAGANMLSNCEAETNLGAGILVSSTGADGTGITGCDLWGNAGNGLYTFGGTRYGTVTGCRIRNNGVTNTGGTTATGFANVCLEGGIQWSLTGNTMWDDGSAIAAGSYGTYTPTNPYTGRTAQFTVSAHVVETNAGVAPADNVIIGNVMKKEQTRTNVSYTLLSVSDRFAYNNVGGVTSVTARASAAALTLTADTDLLDVTGTTQITSIVASYPGRRVTLRFTSATPAGITDGGNLQLAGNFIPTQNDTITLCCDGTNWVEASRSGDI